MKAPRHKYTQEQLTFLSDNRTMPRTELAEAFNKRFGTSLSVPAIKGICKSRKWHTGRDGRFEKGNIPSPSARPKGPNKGSFKKGQKPKNWQPIGTERITTEGYRQRKITDTGNTVNDYVEVHRLVWEEHNGPIPEGHVITFRDGDCLNCEIDNLMLITRAELAVINKMQLGKVSPELKEPVVQLARLKMKQRERVSEGAEK